MTAPHDALERTPVALRWAIMTDPDLFMGQLKDLFDGPTDIAARLERRGYYVDRKTVGRWLSGESDPSFRTIPHLLKLIEAEHARRAERSRAFFGEG